MTKRTAIGRIAQWGILFPFNLKYYHANKAKYGASKEKKESCIKIAAWLREFADALEKE